MYPSSPTEANCYCNKLTDGAWCASAEARGERGTACPVSNSSVVRRSGVVFHLFIYTRLRYSSLQFSLSLSVCVCSAGDKLSMVGAGTAVVVKPLPSRRERRASKEGDYESD